MYVGDFKKQYIEKSKRLSKYIKTKVDFLKMDIEGSETLVIQEIKDKLNLIKEMVIEFHGTDNNPGNKIEVILDILKKAGFECRIQRPEVLFRKKKVSYINPFWAMIYAKQK